MSSLAFDLDRLLHELDPGSAALLERDVRIALARAERRAREGTACDALGYPASYFEDTAGSFANEPLDASPELPMQAREPW